MMSYRMKVSFSMQKIISVLFIATIAIVSVLIVKTFELNKKMALIAKQHKVFSSDSLVFAPINTIQPDSQNPYDRFFYVLSQQPLIWSNKGSHMVVFETEDKKYIVKFFLNTRHHAASIKESIASIFSFKSKEQIRLEKEQQLLFDISKICFEQLAEQTGFIYIHLNKTNEKIKGVKLIGPFKHGYRIRGDDVCFIVQKKATFLIPTFVALLESHNFPQACQRIDQLFALLFEVARKGYVDKEVLPISNNTFGFCQERALYIDPMQLIKADNIDLYTQMHHELYVRLKPFHDWLESTWPTLAQYYEQQRSILLAQIIPKPDS